MRSSYIDNLLYLEEINIENCIQTLETRFKKKKIYTRLGGILLSINPYQYFTGKDNIYDFENKDSVHIYRTLDTVFERLIEKNQVIIVSGESGSGKTETTKQIIHYLNHRVSGNSLVSKIEASGLVLEIFGNAPTQKNHNSSRFGKFIEVFYNDSLECLGMKTSVYLLEKTRVLNIEDFGKFHIFTQDRAKTIVTLELAGFNNENIQFILKAVDLIHELLGVQYEKVKNPIYRDLVSYKTTDYQGEKIRKDYTREEFIEIRNILVMKLYDTLFVWLVEKMNSFYGIPEKIGKLHSIGILDIFGFEELQNNSLEQLSINYANEIIQALLNRTLIEDKLSLYRFEEIPLDEIEIKLNREQIELIEQIFIKLDEECMLPRGNSTGLIEKINLRFSDNPFYKTNKLTKMRNFQIEHYAGLITYEVEDFCKKNIDRQHNEIDSFIQSMFPIENGKKIKKTAGKLKINSITNQFRNQLADFINTISSAELYFIKCIKPNNLETPMDFDNELVGTQLKYNGILQLIQILKQGYSYHFFIKPFMRDYSDFLEGKSGFIFGKTRIFLTEECYTSIKIEYLQKRLEAIQIIQHFTRCKLVENKYLDKVMSSRFIENYLWTKCIQHDYRYHLAAFRLQRFFRQNLNKAKDKRNRMAIRIARFFRMCHLRNSFLQSRKSAIKIQSIWKCWLQKRSFSMKKEAINKIKKWWRIYLRKRDHLKKHNQYLEDELKDKNRKICELQKRIIELEQRLSRSTYIDKSIINERDHFIVELKRDIESYQNNIRERLDEKMLLTDTIDRLKIENGLLIRQISYMRRTSGSSWLSRMLGLDSY